MLLVRVDASFRLDRPDTRWLEGELVRRGARDAHLTQDGGVAILVAAGSAREAWARASDLLLRAGATQVRISAPAARSRADTARAVRTAG